MRLSLIGLGAMGLPIAQRLAEQGVADLGAFDASPDRMALLPDGVRSCESLKEAVADADVIMTVLPADRHVKSVVEDMLGVVRAGQMFVDLSTIAPSTIEWVADSLDRHGVATTSVALTRGATAARNGSLGLFIGAPDGIAGDLKPIFGAMSSQIELVGGHGAAKVIKIANNMIMSVLNIVISEALVVAEGFGVPGSDVAEYLATNGSDSWVLRTQIVGHLFSGDVGPGFFSTTNMHKDVLLYLDTASEAEESASLAAVCSASYRGLRALGHAEDYHPIVYEWVKHCANAHTYRETSTSEGPDSVLRVLGAGVRAVQTLADLEAFRVMRHYGLEPSTAAGHLVGASGSNEGFAGVVHHLEDSAGSLDVSALVRDLADVSRLCDVVNVPAMMFETARQSALQLQQAFSATARG